MTTAPQTGGWRHTGLTQKGIARAFTLVMILAGSVSAAAYHRRGNDLVEDMRAFEKVERGDDAKVPSYPRYAHYQSFVIGVSDALDGVSFCVPQNATVNQVATVVAKYLNAHPEEWNLPAYVLVTKALKSAYPCESVRQ